jgi:hypothetical protein
MTDWPAPDPTTVVEGIAAPVRATTEAIVEAIADAPGRLADRIRAIEWRPWRLTSDRIAGTTIATSPRREQVSGPTPDTPTAPLSGDAAEVVGGMPTTSSSRSARRERDACRGVGRAPARSDDGRQICGWCGEIVDVIGDRCGAHKRPQKVVYVASVRIGGRDG